MTKVAFSVWDNRIAPVFDVAHQFRIIHVEGGRVAGEVEETIVNDAPSSRALRLAELGVTTLVCGAISRELLAAVSAYGIRVIPFVAGDVREVIRALLEGTVHRREYTMPGCRRRRRPDHATGCGAPGKTHGGRQDGRRRT